MCSYNAINGVPACCNKDLLVKAVRQDMGFGGVIATDCGAINDIVANHHYTQTAAEAVVAALDATVDSNCGQMYLKLLGLLVANKTIAETALTPAVQRLMESRLRLGLFDNSSLVPLRTLGAGSIDSPAHRALALRAAREAVVLLTNTDNTLPLPLLSRPTQTVAFVGPTADVHRNMLSGYHGTPPPDLLQSPLEALRQQLGGDSRVLHALGSNIMATNSSLLAAARSAATSADVVVVGLGLCGNNYMSDEDSVCEKINEAEGTDRTDILLPQGIVGGGGGLVRAMMMRFCGWTPLFWAGIMDMRACM